ncbi:MAG: DUF2130 domain-containing protein [Sulfurovum sp.]|nr:MAG: DUF2130 domain-containing protein [Sulfurovum sp.]
MSKQTTIKCPNCHVDIDVNEILYHQLEEELKQKNLAKQKQLQDEIEAQKLAYKEAFDSLQTKEEAIAEQQAKYKRDLKKATEIKLEEQLHLEKQKLKAQIRAKIVAEREDEMKLLSDELQKKSEQVKELNVSKAQIVKLQMEKEELSSKAKADAEIELAKRLTEEKDKLRKLLDEEIALKIRAKDEQIEQMRRDIESAKRKAEQGSMQIQGEALELSIETWLTSQFPFDTVDEVKKGAFGADCIHTIHTRTLQNCGIICYESKNTKAWSDSWIVKLKQDMLKVDADLGVLVTAVYPNNMNRMGFVDGIWVCNLDEFKGSVSLLRESLIRVHQTMKREENRGDKMALLYHYLTGNEFQLQLQSIVDGFMRMQNELDKERRSLMASWKRRQKLIDAVLQNTTEMYGSLQGIAGTGVIGQIKSLELTDENED